MGYFNSHFKKFCYLLKKINLIAKFNLKFFKMNTFFLLYLNIDLFNGLINLIYNCLISTNNLISLIYYSISLNLELNNVVIFINIIAITSITIFLSGRGIGKIAQKILGGGAAITTIAASGPEAVRNIKKSFEEIKKSVENNESSNSGNSNGNNAGSSNSGNSGNSSNNNNNNK
jgi:hypothetical protein